MCPAQFLKSGQAFGRQLALLSSSSSLLMQGVTEHLPSLTPPLTPKTKEGKIFLFKITIKTKIQNENKFLIELITESWRTYLQDPVEKHSSPLDYMLKEEWMTLRNIIAGDFKTNTWKQLFSKYVGK